MRYFPTFTDLDGRSCLVVGGGAAACAKVRLLLKTPAKITVIASEFANEIAELDTDRALTLLSRPFRSVDIEGHDLVFAATDDPSLDTIVSDAARAAGVAINVVDRPALSSFIIPAIVDRDPLVIGISSAGSAPVLARSVRARIEAILPAGLGRLAGFAESFRSSVKATIPTSLARRRFWEDFFSSSLASRVTAGDVTAARKEMLARVNAHEHRKKGSVAIVGAGPGDPDLLTIKALNYLQLADVVIYDRLAGPDVVDYARRDAERVFAGKAKGRHTLTQDQINHHMLQAAKSGKRVVRLKGGDPFIFGRGSEEKAFLEAHGCEVEVVPGITAATGCAAASGIPLTERGITQAVTFVTGHGANGEPDLDWASLARLNQTLCIYMGVSTADWVADRLIGEGLAPATPAAIVENATRPNQRILRSRLDEVGSTVAREGVAGPAIVLIGEVARDANQAALDHIAESIAV